MIDEFRVPQSAPQPLARRRIAAPDLRGLGAVGAVIARQGEIRAQAAQERQISDARLAMVEGDAQIRQSLAEDRDFATMSERYGAMDEDLHGKVMDIATSPAARDRIRPELERSRLARSADVRSRSFGLERDHVRANLTGTLDALSKSISTASDPKVAAMMMDQAQSAVASAAAGGWISQENAVETQLKFEGDLGQTRAMQLVSTDPARAAKELSKPGALGLEERTRLRFQAQAQRKADAVQARSEKEIAGQVKFAINELLSGRNVPDLGKVRAKATDQQRKNLDDAKSAAEVLGGFYAVPPAERQTKIDEIKAGGPNSPIEARELTMLERIDRAASKDAAADPIAYAGKSNFSDAGDLDLSDPKAIANRAALADVMAEKYGTRRRYFTNSQREALADEFGQGSVGDQINLATSIAAGFGPRAHDALDELGASDKVFGYVGHLVASTGSSAAATAILRGRAARKAGGAPAPDTAIRDSAASALIGDAVSMAAAGMRETIIDMAKSCYADKAPGRVGDDDDDAQSKLFRECVQEVAGQIDGPDGKKYGGFQSVKGERVLLPSNLNSDQVENAIDNAAIDNWRAASISGGAPRNGDEVELPAKPVLLPVADGIYVVGVRQRGRLEFMADDSAPNGLFLVRLADLVKSVPEKPGFFDWINNF